MDPYLERLFELDLGGKGLEMVKAMNSTPATMLIYEEYKKLRDCHLQGAAMEFALHKAWGAGP
eukprot:5938533-Karenia_brevis.AAC.1